MIDQQAEHHPLEGLRPVVTTARSRALHAAVRAVYVDDLLRRWIIELVRSTREVEMCTLGASVRGTLALERAARAWALLDGREYVVSTTSSSSSSPSSRTGSRSGPPSAPRLAGPAGTRRSKSSATRASRLAPAPELRDSQPV